MESNVYAACQRIGFIFWQSGFCFAGMGIVILVLEAVGIALCLVHWYELSSNVALELLKNFGYAFVLMLPATLLSLLIASLCQNMWVSLGIGVICVFTATMLPADKFILSIFPFALPFQIFAGVAETVIRNMLIASVIETAVIAFCRRNTFEDKEGYGMSFLSLLGVEYKKIRRSKIMLILAIAVIILWLPSIFNVDMNFQMQAEGISPEYNFLIQGFLGMAWFIFPASMVVSTVLLNQTERSNKGILKMLTLPVCTAKLCMAKFVVLLSLATVQVLMSVGMYYLSAAIVTGTQNYNFILSPLFVFQEAGMLLVSSIPMLAFFWLLSVWIQTPIFSVRDRTCFDCAIRIDD